MPTKPLPSRNILAGSGTGTPGPPGTLSVPVPNWNTTMDSNTLTAEDAERAEGAENFNLEHNKKSRCIDNKNSSLLG